MIGLAGGRAIFLATGVTDLRRGFAGLYALILDHLGQEPSSRAVFAFCNRRRDTVKLFCFDQGGVWLCAKRLEQGTFRWPGAGTRTVQLTAADLHLLLSGVDPARTRLRRWWAPVTAGVLETHSTPTPWSLARLSRTRAGTYLRAAMSTASHAATAATAAAPDAVAALQARVRDLEGENQRLTLRVRDLQQQLWGRKAERGLAVASTSGALSLFDDAMTAAAPAGAAPGRTGPRATTGTRPGPKPLDPRLPRELIALPDPPTSARRCALTGAALVPGFREQLEVLARRPAVYYVKRFERTVWVSPTKTAPLATPWPADVLPRARMHVSVLAHVAAAHYAEHLPFYRLEQQLARTGVTLARSTQVALMTQLDALVAPLVAHLKAQVLGSGYVHLDATPVDVCDPQRPGRVREATLWAYRARSGDPAVEGLVWFEYQASKSPAHPRAVLADYRGVLQTDGAVGLDALGAPGAVTHLGCWAHARRRFVQALRLGDARAGPYLAQCDRLFRLDARARRIVATQPAHAPRVATWRARFSVPLVEALVTRAAADGLTLPPKSALGHAVGYLLAQRAPLTRCVTTPGARLDNNAVENAIRPVKLGAKNWLFVGHPEAGPRLPNLFTLVENARQAGVDIERYLADLLTNLPSHSVRRLGEWLPTAWQQRERHRPPASTG